MPFSTARDRAQGEAWSPPTKRGLVRFRHRAKMGPMRSLKLLLLVLLVPFGFAATALADENKPSFTYYYFDG